jgi:hypothetical protein
MCGCYSDRYAEALGFGGLVRKSFLDCPGERVDPERHEALGQKRDGLWDEGLSASVKEELAIEILGERAWFQAQVNADLAASMI